MSTEANKAIVRRFFENFTQATVEELLVPSYVHHDPGLPAELQQNRDSYQQVVGMFTSAFPDLKVTVADLVAEGDKVVARWTFTGTHRGELMGIPPTGQQVMGTGISIQRFTDGKIAEGWVNFDTLGMLQQLGAIPAMG